VNARAVLDAYEAEADELLASFESVASAEVYAHVAHLLPRTPSRVLDIGAGTGRDAAWFAEQGHFVLAVEPTARFREAGSALHASSRIEWLDDRLPDLAALHARGERFDTIVLCGVWHHLDEAEQRAAMPRLAPLLAEKGRLVLSLRHGPGLSTRQAHPQDADDTHAGAAGLARISLRGRVRPSRQPCARGRAHLARVRVRIAPWAFGIPAPCYS